MNQFHHLLLVCLLTTSSPVLSEDRVIPTGPEGRESAVTPFLRKHCLACHGADKSRGDFQVHDLINKEFDPTDVKRWQNIMEMVETGDMPPAKRPQPTNEEREAFEAAVNSQLEVFNVGRNAWEKEHPRYANRVDHDALFSGEHKGPAYTPARVWRISGDIYQRLMKDFELGFDFVVPLQNNTEGFHDYSRLYADEATIRTMKQNARRVATALVKGKPTRPRRGEDPTRHVKGFTGTRHKAIRQFLEIQGEPSAGSRRDVVHLHLHHKAGADRQRDRPLGR